MSDADGYDGREHSPWHQLPPDVVCTDAGKGKHSEKNGEARGGDDLLSWGKDDFFGVFSLGRLGGGVPESEETGSRVYCGTVKTVDCVFRIER